MGKTTGSSKNFISIYFTNFVLQVVMFNLEVGEAPNKPSGKEEEVDHNKLEDMIKELASTLKTVKHEQEYMQVCFLIACNYHTLF